MNKLNRMRPSPVAGMRAYTSTFSAVSSILQGHVFLSWVTEATKWLLCYILSVTGPRLYCPIFHAGIAWHYRRLFTPVQWHANHHQPEVTANLAVCHMQDLGSTGTFSDNEPLPGKRWKLLSTNVLGLVQTALRKSPVCLESMGQRDRQRGWSIKGWFLYPYSILGLCLIYFIFFYFILF